MIATVLAATLGLAAGLIDLPEDVRLSVFVSALAILVIFDIHALIKRSSSLIGLRRQTPQRYQNYSRPHVVALVWGLDIGTGVTTFRVTSASWLLLLAVAMDLAPMAFGLLYGAGLVLALAILDQLGFRGELVRRRLGSLLAMRSWLQLLYVVLASSLLLINILELV